MQQRLPSLKHTAINLIAQYGESFWSVWRRRAASIKRSLLAASWLTLQLGQPAHAAKNQYIQMTNCLAAASDVARRSETATPVIVALYAGGQAPCFSILLEYGLSATLATGARSPCTSAVERIAVVPLASRTYGAIYGPLGPLAVDPSLTNFTVKVESLASPVFDVHNGALQTPGTAHLTFDAM